MEKAMNCWCFVLVPTPKEDEFAIFAHQKERIYTDFNEIRREIEAETERLGGKKVRLNWLIFLQSDPFLFTEYLQRTNYTKNLLTKSRHIDINRSSWFDQSIDRIFKSTDYFISIDPRYPLKINQQISNNKYEI